MFAYFNIFIVWGTTFLANTCALQSFPPFILSGFRFFVAGLLIMSWQYLKGEKLISLVNWGKNTIAGILILTGGTGLVIWGQQYVSSSEAAISLATGPFLFIAFDRKNWKNYFSDKFIPIGLIVGFTGLVIFLKSSMDSPEQTSNITMRILAFIILGVSSICWVLGSLYSKNYPAKGQSTFMNIAQQLIAAGVISFIIAAFNNNEWKQFSVSAINPLAFAGLGYLILFGSTIAYISYIWLLSVKPAALVGTHNYINPIVAVMVGLFFTSEAITGLQIYGLLTILLGMLLTNVTSYFRISEQTKAKIKRQAKNIKNAGILYKPITEF